MFDAIATLKVQAKDKNITLKTDDFSPTLKAKVEVNKILWVLTNLIANAICFSRVNALIEQAIGRNPSRPEAFTFFG